MLKIGLFGVGHLGKFHIKNWKEIDQIDIVGFYDPDDKNAEEVIVSYGLKRYTDMNQLMEDADAIDVVTPTQFHYQVCEAALRKTKHVFVEKPLANNMQEASALLKLTKEAKVKFQVGHVERFNPAFLALNKESLNPMFIEVHRLAQFNPRGTEVSVILDLMIHDIDIILSIVKSDIKQISASGVAVMTETPDIANVRIEFHNGCVANLTSSRISLKKMRKMRLFQKDAYIGVDFLEKKSEVIRLKEENEESELFTFEIETPQGIKSIVVENPTSTIDNALKAELTSFRDSIVQDTNPVVSELDGYHALEVAHLILDKIQNQKSN
ncbi:MAG: gfo/Idh/MocA family oxidoreductase [Chitinophagia bacterium]|nr:gfo/Idh/MocA family oxidoreductase [Chitinophagia bacterium]